MRVRFGWMVLAAMSIAGCTETGTVEQAGGDVKVVLSVANALAGEQIDVLPHYVRTDRSRVDFPSTRVDVGGAATQQVSLDLDITQCRRDPLRETLGAGCPLRVAVVLRSATGATVDSQLVGPIDLVAGQTTTAPSVTLRRFGSVILHPSRDTLNNPDTTTVSLTVKDRQGASLGTRPATWTTDAPAIVTVSATGFAVAHSPGVATITAALVADPSVQGSISIPVRGIVGFDITPDSVVLAIPGSLRPATTISAIGVSANLAWRSALPAIATVDATSGVITSVSPGRTTIYAQSVADAARRDSVVAVVSGIVSLAVTPDTALLVAGGLTQLATTVVVSGGASTAVLYSSATPAVATVDQAGVVTAVTAGTALVRAVSAADPTKRDSVVVRVFSPASNALCSAATFVVDTIRKSRQLTVAQSPYRFPKPGVVTGGAILVIDPGVTICVDQGITLTMERGSSLSARGSGAAPIRFTASDPAQPWGGLAFTGQPVADSSYVTNALLEFGAVPQMTVWTSAHPVVYDSVRFRQWRGAAVALQRGRLSRSVVDTTVVGGSAAVYLGQGTKFENTTVRQADFAGVMAADTVRFVGGRIQGAATGLVNLLGSLPPRSFSGVVITANRGVPARLEPNWVAVVARDSLKQIPFLGNGINAIATEGTLANDTIRVFGHLGLIVTGLRVDARSLLQAWPGAQVQMEANAAINTFGFITFINGGRLDAHGTLPSPVLFTTEDPLNRFDGLFFYGSQTGAPLIAPPGDTTRIINTIVERGGRSGNAIQISTDGLPVIIDSTLVRLGPAGGIQVGYTPAPSFAFDTSSVDHPVSIARTRVETSGSSSAAAVLLMASSRISNSVIRGNRGLGLGLFKGVADSITIDSNGGDGVEILSLQPTVGPFTLIWSNILGNGGFSVRYTSSSNPVSIGNNWWGPLGANILGPADATPQLNGPIGLITPYPAPPAMAPARTAGAGASGVPLPPRRPPPGWRWGSRIHRR